MHVRAADDYRKQSNPHVMPPRDASRLGIAAGQMLVDRVVLP
jgi:hypothetical protein